MFLLSFLEKWQNVNEVDIYCWNINLIYSSNIYFYLFTYRLGNILINSKQWPWINKHQNGIVCREIALLFLKWTKNDVIQGQTSWAKMSPGGKLTALACHLGQGNRTNMSPGGKVTALACHLGARKQH
jgi:hypothetical protein